MSSTGTKDVFSSSSSSSFSSLTSSLTLLSSQALSLEPESELLSSFPPSDLSDLVDFSECLDESDSESEPEPEPESEPDSSDELLEQNHSMASVNCFMSLQQ